MKKIEVNTIKIYLFRISIILVLLGVLSVFPYGRFGGAGYATETHHHMIQFGFYSFMLGLVLFGILTVIVLITEKPKLKDFVVKK